MSCSTKLDDLYRVGEKYFLPQCVQCACNAHFPSTITGITICDATTAAITLSANLTPMTLILCNQHVWCFCVPLTKPKC